MNSIDLFDAQSKPVLIDSSILMVGIQHQSVNPNYSFENLKIVYLDVLFGSFTNIIIHRKVYDEQDDNRKKLIDKFIGENINIVDEDEMYGTDPIYTDIFNKISKFDLFNYKRGQSNNQGEVYSLAYAAYHKIPFFSVRDGSAIIALREIPELNSVKVVGFEKILALSFLCQPKSKELKKVLQALYKSQCQIQIRNEEIPETLNQYIRTLIKND